MAQLESLFSRYDRLVIFDTETTGLQYSRDEIIEFAAVVVEQRGGIPTVSGENFFIFSAKSAISFFFTLTTLYSSFSSIFA